MRSDSWTKPTYNTCVDEADYAAAQQNYDQAKYDDAIRAVASLMREARANPTREGKPNVRDAVILKARVLHSLQRYPECEGWLSRSRHEGCLPADDIDARSLELSARFNQGAYECVVREATELLNSCQSSTSETARILLLRGLAYLQTDRLEAGLESCGDARSLLRLLRSWDECAALCTLVGNKLVQRGHLAEAVEYLRGSLSLHGTLKCQESVASDHRRLGRVYADMGQFGTARRHLKAAVEIADGEYPRELCRSLVVLGDVDRMECAVETSHDHLMRAYTLSSRAGFMESECRSLCALGDLYIDRGDFEEALSFLARSRSLAEEATSEDDLTMGILRREGQCLMELGRFDEARAAFERSLERAAPGCEVMERNSVARSLGELDLRFGRRDDAAQKFDEASRGFASAGADFELAITYLKEAAASCVDHLDTEPWLPDPSVARRAAYCGRKAWFLFDKLELPKWADRAQTVIDDLARRESARRPVKLGRRRRGQGSTRSPMIAVSTAMKRVQRLADEYASLPDPVLIMGETGTGKELVARRIHEHGCRKTSPMVVVNCSAIPADLFEREFFGHAQGAFTGAGATSPGYVDQAHGGTLFLDEIGDMPLPLQSKLLRLIENSSYYRLGDPVERRANVRVIAATNASLPDLVSEKSFRADLYYRLRLVDIRIPPLRERPRDIIPLLELFLGHMTGRAVRAVECLEPHELDELMLDPLRGNARDLMYFARRSMINKRLLGRLALEAANQPEVRARPTRSEIERLVQRFDGNKAKLARHFGVARSTLYRWLAESGN